MHESELSLNSFPVEFVRFSFWIEHSKCRFEIMQTLIEISLWNETRNEIDVHYGRNKIVCKIVSFIHLLKCIGLSAKIGEKIRFSAHESGTIFNPE